MNHFLSHNTLNSSRCRGPILGSTGDVRLSCALLEEMDMRDWPVNRQSNNTFGIAGSDYTPKAAGYKDAAVTFNTVFTFDKNSNKNDNKHTGNAIIT